LGAYKETVGSQDQVSVAYGGLNQINFLQNGEITVSPIIIPRKQLIDLNSHMMLFYTGIVRTAENVAKSYVNNYDKKKRELLMMKGLVNEAITILEDGNDLSDFGKLMHETWAIKRSLSSVVSNSNVDDIYDLARSAGAIGGKLAGAGGGGFMILFVPPEKHSDVLKKLNKLIYVPFKFDYSGTQIIFHEPEKDYSDLERKRKFQKIDSFKDLEDIQ